jgi:hypothetical protein
MMRAFIILVLFYSIAAGCSSAQSSLSSREQVEIEAADCPPELSYDPASGRCI